MSMSISTYRAQSDSMQEIPMLIVLGKEDEKGRGMGGGWGECDNKGMKIWGRERGEGEDTVENKCDFSCRRKEARSFAS